MKRLAPLLILPLAACGFGVGELGLGFSFARFGFDTKSEAEAPAATPAQFEAPLPEGYPEDVLPLEPPLSADLEYRPFAKQPYLRRVTWRLAPGEAEGPELTLEAKGDIAAVAIKGGVALTLQRTATRLVVDGSDSSYRDKGRLRVAVTADGRFGETDLAFGALKSELERHYVEDVGQGLMRKNRVVAYRPRSGRAGPGDAAAGRIETDERQARRVVVRAVEPLTGIVMGLPIGAVSRGDAVMLMKRNLGLLFRGSTDIPVTVEGVVAGVAKLGDRRVLVIDAGEARTTSGHRVDARGYGLLDLEAGVFLKTDVTLRLIVGKAQGERVFLVRDTSRIGGSPKP